MSKILETNIKEKSFEFMQTWNDFGIGIGYQYSKGYEDEPNLIYFKFAFWSLDYVW